MTDYGLLTTGFSLKPASAIKSDIFAAIAQIDGFEEVRTDKGPLSLLVDAFTEELSIVWEAAEASAQAISRDMASGASLDAVLAMVGKARQQADTASTTLHLWTLNTSGSVSVPSGNQVQQSSTETLWETTADATIPVAVTVLEDLNVANITWQSGTTVRYTFSGTPDLSAVVATDLLIITGAGTASNDGAFAITAVNNGADWIEVTNVNRTSSTGDETGSAATGTTTDGWITVTAETLETGDLTAAAQSVDTINTPVSNWDGCANLADAIAGQETESDSDFRRRAAAELVIAQGSTLEAVKAQLREVDGVTYASGEENRTATTDGNGNLPHSQRFTVVGGTDQDIIDTIGTYKAAGIATNGDESGTYTDPEGNTATLYFDRVSQTTIHIEVQITTDSDYPADGDTSVRTALTEYGETLEHGEDIYNWKLVGAIFEADIPGITAMTILQGTSDPPVSSANTAIAADAVGYILSANIDIT